MFSQKASLLWSPHEKLGEYLLSMQSCLDSRYVDYWQNASRKTTSGYPFDELHQGDPNDINHNNQVSCRICTHEGNWSVVWWCEFGGFLIYRDHICLTWKLTLGPPLGAFDQVQCWIGHYHHGYGYTAPGVDSTWSIVPDSGQLHQETKSRVSLEENEMMQISEKNKMAMTQLLLDEFLSNFQWTILTTICMFAVDFKFPCEIFIQLSQFLFSVDGRHLCLKAVIWYSLRSGCNVPRLETNPQLRDLPQLRDHRWFISELRDTPSNEGSPKLTYKMLKNAWKNNILYGFWLRTLKNCW